MNYQKQLIEGTKRLRKQLNLTQEQFAEKVGLTLEGIRNIEQGRSTPTAKTIDMICTTFRTRPIDLLLDTPTGDKLKLKQILLDKIDSSDLDELQMVNDLFDFVKKHLSK